MILTKIFPLTVIFITGAARSEYVGSLAEGRSLFAMPDQSNTTDVQTALASYTPITSLLPQGSSCIAQGSTIPDGTLLSQGPLNVSSFSACCTACSEQNATAGSDNGCNVFAYCPFGSSGCAIPTGSVGAGVYPEGSCLLYFQQSLQLSGNVIKAVSYSTNQNINFVAGAPAQAAPTGTISVPEYAVTFEQYAWASLPNMTADISCGEAGAGKQTLNSQAWSTGAATFCELTNVTRQEAAAACAQLPTCWGFQYLPNGPIGALSGAPSAVLKGMMEPADLSASTGAILEEDSTVMLLVQNATEIQFRLLVNNYLSQAPTAELYMKALSLPSAADFTLAFWRPPQANLSNTVSQPSGCAVEYHTQYRGEARETLFNIASAIDCCAACERSSLCNSWNFCPNPHGCNLTDIMAMPLQSFPGFSCRLLWSDIVEQGLYPSVIRQDPMEAFTSGLPPKEVKRASRMFTTTPRPNALSPGSANCTEAPNTLFAGLPLLNASSTQPSAEACCSACRNHTLCNTYQWCPAGGEPCANDFEGLTYRAGSCQLLYSAAVAISCPAMPLGAMSPLESLGSGPSVPWMSGNPIRVANETVANYTLYAYANFAPPFLGDDIECPGAEPDELLGVNFCRYEVPTLQAAAQLCYSHPQCQAFLWAPHGDMQDRNSFERGVVFLKGNLTAEVLQNLSANVMPNPSMGLYVRNEYLGIVTPVPSSSSSNLGLILGLSIGLGVAALCIVALLVALLYRRRQNAEDEVYAPLSVALRRVDELHRDGPSTGKSGFSDSTSIGDALKANEKQPPHSRDSDAFVHVGSMAGASPPSHSAREGADTQADSTSSNGDEQHDAVATGGKASLHSSEWEVKPNELEVCKDLVGKDVVLGKGAFGTVFKARYRGGMYCAVKQLMMTDDEESGARVRGVIKEIEILKGARSPNIVQFLGACQLSDRFLIVTELMEGGSLWTQLQRGKVNWNKRGAAIALDCALGLHYLHSRRTLHLDLKSANILLDRNGRAKIADVGVAQIRNSTYIKSLDGAGTYAWAAPEVLLGERVGSAADVFSFGVLLWEIVTGETPQRGSLRAVRVPEECPQAISDLIKACMQATANQRPAMDQVINVLRENRLTSKTSGNLVQQHSGPTSQQSAEFGHLDTKVSGNMAMSG